MFDIFRNKIGPNLRYAGVQVYSDLIKNHTNCFAIVQNKAVFDLMKIVTPDSRDYDLLQESLGNENNFQVHPHSNYLSNLCILLGFLLSPYILTGYKYASQKTIKKIDKLTSSLMESGLDRFYESFANFLFNLYSRNISKQAENDMHPMNITFMRGPLILYFCLLGFASVIFIIEIIGHNFIKLRSRRRIYQLQNRSV